VDSTIDSFPIAAEKSRGHVLNSLGFSQALAAEHPPEAAALSALLALALCQAFD
jgi:hypothetical protein